MKTRHIAIVPRDGMFCKDGRGWHTRVAGRGHALAWPWPTTVLGALRTAWGRGEEARLGVTFGANEWRERTAAIQLGAMLALRRPHGAPWSRAHRVWPVPLDAIWLEGETEVRRLDPRPAAVPTLGRDDDEAREALWVPLMHGPAQKPRPRPRWWTERDAAAWLSGLPVSVRNGEGMPDMPRRIQTRVGIRAEELTSEEGMLFSHDVLETTERSAEWAIGAEVSLPEGDLADVATLGSDSRVAWLEAVPEPVFEPPDELLDAFRAQPTGLRVVVVTPACFEGGWLPDGLTRFGQDYRGRLGAGDVEVVLRAALVPRPLHVSGWDVVARQPKPTSRMVAPGAVYYFERVDGRPFDERIARALWLSSLGVRTSEGFGRIVAGVWTPQGAMGDED